MLTENVQMGRFISDMKTLINSIILKRNAVAVLYETDIEAKKRADKYINMIEYGMNWNAYVGFDYDVFVAAGIDPLVIPSYLEDKENIPRELRNRIMSLQQASIIDNYVEENEYYRMLHGDPPLDTPSSEWVYVYPNNRGVPTNIPIHLMPYETISFMQACGIMDKLIEMYPDKAYLKYQGDKSISYYNARTSDNYEILYFDGANVDENILSDFRIAYSKARTYFMVGLYNPTYSNMFLWYDEFIGLCIMIMAIQRTIANIYKQGLTRDFYDIELIKYLFKSYSIPYIEDLDIQYQKALAKNLNYLLQYKSTDKVLYDVSYLLGLYNINIYKYYLIKEHKINNDGNPIFRYTTDESGKKVPVYEDMFNFHFQKVNLKSKDINTALTDNKNSVDFYTITEEDPYWINDAELFNKLYQNNFNSIITKYMSLDVAYKIVEMMYEVAYTIRMIIDDREDFKSITMHFPKIASHEFNLFDIIIFLCAVVAQTINLPGKIPLKGYQIPSVYGFNYKADLDRIREDIYNNQGEFTHIDPSLVQYILNMKAATLSDVHRIFTNLTELRKIITKCIFLTKDKETYFQYVKLYKSLLLIEDVSDVYKDYDGNVKDTYENLLAANNSELYGIYVNIKDGLRDPNLYIDEIYYRLSTLSQNYKYLATYNNKGLLFEQLLKLIRFFKSYTVDFVNSGILYFLDDRYLMGMKLLDNVDYYSCPELDDLIFNKGRYYKDYIETIAAYIRPKEYQSLEEFTHANVFMTLFQYKHWWQDEDGKWHCTLVDDPDHLKFSDSIFSKLILPAESSLYALDFRQLTSNKIFAESRNIKFGDDLWISIFIDRNWQEYITLVNKIYWPLNVYLNGKLNSLDIIEKYSTTPFFKDEGVMFNDDLWNFIHIDRNWEENINLIESKTMITKESLKGSLSMIDDMASTSTELNMRKSTIRMGDSLKYTIIEKD